MKCRDCKLLWAGYTPSGDPLDAWGAMTPGEHYSEMYAEGMPASAARSVVMDDVQMAGAKVAGKKMQKILVDF